MQGTYSSKQCQLDRRQHPDAERATQHSAQRWRHHLEYRRRQLVIRADSQGSTTNTGTIIFNISRSAAGSTSPAAPATWRSITIPTSYTSPTDYTPTGQGGGTRGVTWARRPVHRLHAGEHCEQSAGHAEQPDRHIRARQEHHRKPVTLRSATASRPSMASSRGGTRSPDNTTRSTGLNVFRRRVVRHIGSNGDVRNFNLTNVNIRPYYTSTVGAVAVAARARSTR